MSPNQTKWMICPVTSSKATLLLWRILPTAPGHPGFACCSYLGGCMFVACDDAPPFWFLLRHIYTNITLPVSLRSKRGRRGWRGSSSTTGWVYMWRFRQLDASQRQRSYQQFYKVLTAHWFMVEMLWDARIIVYQSPHHWDKAHVRIWDMWTNTPQSLPEKVDIVEVVDFVRGFLARKIFNLLSYSTWLQGQREEIVGLYRDRDETGDWRCFVACFLEFLQLPHILELLILPTWSSGHTWKLDLRVYLRRLGFFNTWDGIVEHGDQIF